jgi:hypothetical protein
VLIDPLEVDPFRVFVEERHRLDRRTDLSALERKRLELLLKTMANSGSYGIYGQMNRKPMPVGETASVSVWCGEACSFTARTSAPEDPGPYSFPPIAALITGAARLLLALLERFITDAGGTYMMTDTDSMLVVSSKDGELLPCPGGVHRTPDGREAVLALSHDELERIRGRFAQLNPYDCSAVPGPLFELEDENYALCGLAGHDADCVCTKVPEPLFGWAISAKRYVLFNRTASGGVVIRKFSEHGLGGVYMDPTDPTHKLEPRGSVTINGPDEEEAETEEQVAITPAKGRRWVAQAWEMWLREELGLPPAEPPWLERTAVSQLTVSSPPLLKPFKGVNAGRPRHRQVRPFNFVLLAHPVDEFSGSQVSPMAPFEPDARKWERMQWYDRVSGTPLRIRPSRGLDEHLAGGEPRVVVDTYRSILLRYKHHPEAKSLAPDGSPCIGTTRGQLRPRPVNTVGLPNVIGKEGNEIEEVALGLRRSEGEVLNSYRNADRELWQKLVVPVLRTMPIARVCAAGTLGRKAAVSIRSGEAFPHANRQLALTWEAVMYAQEALSLRGEVFDALSSEVREACQARGVVLPEGLAILAQFVAAQDDQWNYPHCAVCGKQFRSVSGRARYCSAQCRQRGHRNQTK